MKQALILAAGLGTRLKPLTDSIPKALVKVAGKPLLDWNLLRLQQAGYERMVVNVHHFAEQIVEYIAASSFAPMVSLSDESDALLETGGALKRAAPLFRDDSPVLVHNVDILDNVDYEWFATQHSEDIDALLLVGKRKTSRYLLFDEDMRLAAWVNTATGETRSPYPEWNGVALTVGDDGQVCGASGLRAFAFAGIHSFSPRLFPLMERFPDRFSIIDFYLQVCREQRICGCVGDGVRMLDVGKFDALSAAEDFVKSYF